MTEKWRVINGLIALLTLTTALPAIVSVLVRGIGSAVTFLPFILVEVTQVVLLLLAGRPIYESRAFKEFALACSAALLPVFAAGYFNAHSVLASDLWMAHAGSVLTLVAQVWILYALFNIRTSFSILPEARQLRVKGLYQVVRHPIYLGYFVWYAGSAMVLQNLAYALVMLFICVLQVWRAKLEDYKLALLGDQAVAYQQNTGMFFPNLHFLRNR